MLKVWTVYATLSATPPTPLTPCHLRQTEVEHTASSLLP